MLDELFKYEMHLLQFLMYFFVNQIQMLSFMILYYLSFDF